MLKRIKRLVGGAGASTQPHVTLNDGRRMPQLGLEVWQRSAEEAANSVAMAINAGYQSVDTSGAFNNELGVGQAICETGAAVFLTTKLLASRQGYDRAMDAFDQSAERVGRESVDLHLVHGPSPQQGLYVETWSALVQLQAQGFAKSIGVSNFDQGQLEAIIKVSGVTPAVNQIELNPRFQQRPLRAFHAQHGIATQARNPLGGEQLVRDPLMIALAKKYRKTTAQIIIRWHLDSGLVVIPKATNAEQIRQHIDVFDFVLDPSDIAVIDRLDASAGGL
jgi:2,5-diketo-D-gluconate reductase A